MQPVIVIEHRKATGTLCPTHGKQVHGVVVHAHQGKQTRRFLGTDIESMLPGTERSETGVQQIEIGSRTIIVEVGIKPQETGNAHQEDQMEIGKALRTGIEPADRILQIGEKRGIGSLVAHGTVEELGQKQDNGRLAGMEGNGGERVRKLGLRHLVEGGGRTHLSHQLHQRQGLEQGGLQGGFAGTGQMDQKRASAHGLGIRLDQQRRFLVL